jgi:hypothetical protein
MSQIFLDFHKLEGLMFIKGKEAWAVFSTIPTYPCRIKARDIFDFRFLFSISQYKWDKAKEKYVQETMSRWKKSPNAIVLVRFSPEGDEFLNLKISWFQLNFPSLKVRLNDKTWPIIAIILSIAFFHVCTIGISVTIKLYRTVLSFAEVG